MENWKNVCIDGYEAYYQISDLGRVKRLARELPDGRKIHYSV